MKKFWCRMTKTSKKSVGSEANAEALKATLYEVNVGEKRHTILKTPEDVLQEGDDERRNASFNLIMIDVSGSMRRYWRAILENWNRFLLPVIKGETKLFVFGSGVHFRRKGAYLESSDFLSQSTNLTEAIKIINLEIRKSDKNFIRLFLVTDGHHNTTNISPEVEIKKLSVPNRKTVEVYLLGIGNSFPVEYSISIRSTLHNGNSNVPSLFWANDHIEYGESSFKNINDVIKEQIISMEEIVTKGNVVLKIFPPGKLSPGFPDTDTVHLGEYIYFPSPLEKISSTLNFLTEDNLTLNLEITTEVLDVEDMLENVFSQWNSLIIQHHRKNNTVPTETLEVMNKIYSNSHTKILLELSKTDTNTNSIKSRLAKNRVKTWGMQYKTQMNQRKKIIGLEEKCESEIELANCIVQATVKSKWQKKNSKMKDYKVDSYREDMEEFLNIYTTLKEQIISLPEPTLDSCCKITMNSLVKDLKDPLLPKLLQEDKLTFIKNFTVTGIPIFYNKKPSLNCWTMCISSTITSSCIIISQSTMEITEDINNELEYSSKNKEFYLNPKDESTRFNAIVPVIDDDVSETLKPLIRTNIFAMLSSFCILRNVHSIDHNAHIAALGCTWMKIIENYPIFNRPEFAITAIHLIEVTGKLYLDRDDIVKYLNILLNKTNEALMSENDNINTFMEKDLKCESLIKPIFLLYLIKENIEVKNKILLIFPLLIAEFIWRCIFNYKTQSSYSAKFIYSYFFASGLETKEKRKKECDLKIEETCPQILEDFVQEKGKLLETYFILEHLRKSLKLFFFKQFKSRQKSTYKLGLKTNMVNLVCVDNVELQNLKTLARELNITEETTEELFSEEKLFVYVFHGLKNQNSCERLTMPLPTYEDALKEVTNLVFAENMPTFKELCFEKVLKTGERIWTEQFLSVHENTVARPMTQTQVLYAASQRGIDVRGGFDQVFTYNGQTGLLRNACMAECCPFYLRPSKSFSQHIFNERKPGYPHQLHQVTVDVVSKNGDVDDVIETLLGGGMCGDSGNRERVNCNRGEKCGRIRPVPSEHTLNSLRNQIQRLMTDYKQLK